MAVVSGGTTLIDNGALDPAVPTGKLVLLSTQTASASATIDFTSGIDSTYDSYVFKFINIHGSADSSDFSFNFSVDSGSNYNVAKTTTFFSALHTEDGSETSLAYRTGNDLAQGTGFQPTGASNLGNDNDQNLCGELQLFNPSSTTFVKHFISKFNFTEYRDRSYNGFIAGYGNTQSAINSCQFKMVSGNIDSGVIKLYGIS